MSHILGPILLYLMRSEKKNNILDTQYPNFAMKVARTQLPSRNQKNYFLFNRNTGKVISKYMLCD